jgi:hypothetical protein
VKPTDIQVLRIIHRVVERVIEHGPMFEVGLQLDGLFSFTHLGNIGNHYEQGTK